MVSAYWQTDEGWPYRDGGFEPIDPDSELDEDLLTVRMPSRGLFGHLDPLERKVIEAHYGLGRPARTIYELHAELGLPTADLQSVLGSGLDKLRKQLRT